MNGLPMTRVHSSLRRSGEAWLAEDLALRQDGDACDRRRIDLRFRPSTMGLTLMSSLVSRMFSMSADPILEALKSQTQPLHAQLEARVDILNRLQSPDVYQQLLAAFYGFYAPVESRLRECFELKSEGLDFESRRKVPLLTADLKHWNVAVSELPLASDVPRVASAAEGFGCLYVLEGATLGSQIIKRLLMQHLSVSVENGGAFFNAYGDRVMEMWHSFRASVSQFASAHPHEHDTIIATAQDTFIKLDAWFARRLK